MSVNKILKAYGQAMLEQQSGRCDTLSLEYVLSGAVAQLATTQSTSEDCDKIASWLVDRYPALEDAWIIFQAQNEQVCCEGCGWWTYPGETCCDDEYE